MRASRPPLRRRGMGDADRRAVGPVREPPPPGPTTEEGAAAFRLIGFRPFFLAEEWVEESGFSNLVAQFSVFQKYVHALPQHVVENLNHLLVDKGIAREGFDGIFYNLEFCGDRINARHNFGKSTNILFFDGHAETVPTATLPGGLGPNPPGSADLFSSAALKTDTPQWDWRLDQH